MLENKSPEIYAQDLLNELGIQEAPVDLDRVAKHLGAQVVYSDVYKRQG